MDIHFGAVYWFFGLIGAAVALIGAGLVFGVVRLLQDHWR